jgi:hypothetical protein
VARTSGAVTASTGSAGGDAPVAAPRAASGSGGSINARGRGTDPEPILVGSGGENDFVAQIPRAAGDSFAAYIFFSLFGTPPAAGIVPAFLFPENLAAAAVGGKHNGIPGAAARADQVTSGALGEAVRRLTPAGARSAGSPLWSLLVGLAILLSALAATAFTTFLRGRFHLRIS